MRWFKHDSDAHSDAKIERLTMKYGADGYALYWYCLELIAGKIDKNNITFELEHSPEILAFKLKIEQDRVEEIIKYMVTLGLFSINEETDRIVCIKLAMRLDDATSKNPEIRAAVSVAKENGLINASSQYVYIFKHDDLYKIGRTKNIQRRFADAKMMNRSVMLYGYIQTHDAVSMESKLHILFKSRRTEGEWFSLTNSDLEVFDSIKNIEDIPPNLGTVLRLSERGRKVSR